MRCDYDVPPLLINTPSLLPPRTLSFGVAFVFLVFISKFYSFYFFYVFFSLRRVVADGGFFVSLVSFCVFV